MRKALEDAVRTAVRGKEVAIAFSGGLDSGILAALAKDHADGLVLYTAGTEGSHDVREARSSADELKTRLIHIPIEEHQIRDGLKEIISITGVKDPVTLSFELPLFFVCKNSKEKDILGGQGADELFAGYAKYIGLDKSDLIRMLEEDKKKLRESTIECERKIAEHFGKTIHHPYLDAEVVKAVSDLGIEAIIPTDGPMSRKKVLREVAEMIGYPGISSKGKKSAQYGSGSMAMINKICAKEGVTFSELIEVLAEEAVEEAA